MDGMAQKLQELEEGGRRKLHAVINAGCLCLCFVFYVNSYRYVLNWRFSS